MHTINLFNDKYDVVISLGVDGVSLTKERNMHSLMPFIVQVLNLPPEIRIC